MTANAVAGAVVITGFNLGLGGHTLTVTRGFTTAGTGFLSMSNPLDSLIVGGDAVFGGGASGQMFAGVLVVHGSFVQPATAGPGAFAPTQAFTTAFVGPATHSVQFTDPVSHFQNLDLSQATGTVNLATPVAVHGQLVDTGAVGDTVLGSGRLLTASGVDVTGPMVLDHARLLIQGGSPLTAFNNVTFRDFAGSDVQLEVEGSGSYTFSRPDLLHDAADDRVLRGRRGAEHHQPDDPEQLAARPRDAVHPAREWRHRDVAMSAEHGAREHP